MSETIIELYVDSEDLVKQLNILFDNGYEKVTISKYKDYLVDDGGMTYLTTKYFIRATIGKDNEN